MHDMQTDQTGNFHTHASPVSAGIIGRVLAYSISETTTSCIRALTFLRPLHCYVINAASGREAVRVSTIDSHGFPVSFSALAVAAQEEDACSNYGLFSMEWLAAVHTGGAAWREVGSRAGCGGHGAGCIASAVGALWRSARKRRLLRRQVTASRLSRPSSGSTTLLVLWDTDDILSHQNTVFARGCLVHSFGQQCSRGERSFCLYSLHVSGS